MNLSTNGTNITNGTNVINGTNITNGTNWKKDNSHIFVLYVLEMLIYKYFFINIVINLFINIFLSCMFSLIELQSWFTTIPFKPFSDSEEKRDNCGFMLWRDKKGNKNIFFNFWSLQSVLKIGYFDFNFS